MLRCAIQQPVPLGVVTERPVSILIVDGEPKTATVLVKLLRVDGFEVEVAGDAAGAEACVERGPRPDVLVMDVSPARAGEVETLRRIHARHPALRLVLVTAHPQVAERLALGAAPGCRIVTKPIDYPGLLRLLEAAA
ncbi:response regulator [Nannocystis bainbridge]|uniref:Response regulator n=1 Tax=Nannocystis bainbridge TaxID=2995303 RepID=A0ABT5EC91_9BACT|nr:response regulator [Nannocystis bainbridge]MDC0723490.1 response regulator [Nannocystis bainbridge]